MRPSLRPLALSLGVAIAVSFARFGYALILPAMREQLAWNYAQAGWLNTMNATGYLIGAVLARVLASRMGNRIPFIVGIAMTSLSIMGTGLTRDLWLLSLFRILAGVFGAIAFVAGSALASNIFPDEPERSARTVAIYFAGAGFGFVLCGVTVPWLLHVHGSAAWPQAWLAMGVLALALSFIASYAATQIADPNRTTLMQTADGTTKALRPALIAYTLFGLGYIGYMTFVIAWMRDNGASTLAVIAVWSAFGIASLCGPWIWRYPLTHWTAGKMLSAAIGVMAIGGALPLLSSSYTAMIVSAMLYGVALGNIPGSVTNIVKRARPMRSWSAVVATFTVLFAAGQILGPVLIGWLADRQGSLRFALAVSVAILLLGALFAAGQKDVRASQS